MADATTVLLTNPIDSERTLLTYVLRQEGFRVLSAGSAGESLALAQQGGINVLILESSVPDRERESANALREQVFARNVPVVLFGDRPGERQGEGTAGGDGDGWIGRNGFEVPDFVRRLRELAGGRQERVRADECGEGADVDAATDEKLSEAQVLEVLRGIDHLGAFDFNISEAITTPCRKERIPQQICSIVGRDPMLAVALLGVANRTKAGESSESVTDIQRSVEIVGAKSFYRLAETIPPLDPAGWGTWEPAYYWAHSVATARIAGMLSKTLRIGSPPEAVTAGLLHDIGYAVLARYFPEQLRAVAAAGQRLGTLCCDWEKAAIGVSHEEVGSVTLGRFGLPDVLCEATRVHHSLGWVDHAVKSASRMVAMIVQAADQIADALLPTDIPLTPLTGLSPEFLAAMAHAGCSGRQLAEESRKIVADLITEMGYYFQGSEKGGSFHTKKPLPAVLYHEPMHPALDVVRLFFEVRSADLMSPGALRCGKDLGRIPGVINLAHVSETAAQVEALASVMATGLMRKRKGLILARGALQKGHQRFLDDEWKVLVVPTHPANWMEWLAS